MAKYDKRGNPNYEQYTVVKRKLLSTPAWQSLSTKAQMLYIWLRFEWKGLKANNNGKISLSYRQAAKKLGICVNSAMRAFHELQAKGFIVVTEKGSLGVAGSARSPRYELTEIEVPQKGCARVLYLHWKEGSDYEIVRHRPKLQSP